MVGKKGKKAKSELEIRMTNAREDLNEDFFEPNELLRDNDDSGSEGDQEKDDLLLEKLKSMDGRKSKRLRTEVVSGELDVNINSSNGQSTVPKIKTYEILNSLKSLSDSGTLKKVLAKAHKRTKVLDTPLPKYLDEKAQRISSYLADKKEVSQWEPIVQKNRRAEQLVFPLKQPDFSMQTTNVFTQSWKPETELEKQVAELLQSSENNLKDQKLLTEAELKSIKAMNLDEMKQKRAEFLKLRALQSYQETKFKRLKGIKSKRYRKILKKEREKQELKKMESMEKEDPVQFKEVLDNMEKQRIKERMSLKHKNTSKWAKKLQVYAKFNDKARDQIQEQLDLSKKLTKKLKQFEYDDSDEEDHDPRPSEQHSVDVAAASEVIKSSFGDNPWLKMMSGVGGTAETDQDKDGNTNGEVEIMNLKPIRNEELAIEMPEEKEVVENEKITNGGSSKPAKIQRKRDEKEHKLTLMEAFADDDIVDEFQDEKEKVVEEERVKPIDLTLPGWGSWAGADIDPNEAKKREHSKFKKNKRKKKILVIHPQDVIKTDADRQQLVRKDKDLNHVIISEKKDTKLAEYQINQLPRQFDSVAEFESRIAKPIGRTWNPDFKYRKMIAPKVKTNMGTIIDPIDKDDVIKTIKNTKLNKK